MKRIALQPGEVLLADVRLSWLFIFRSLWTSLACVLTLGLSAYLTRAASCLTVTSRRLVLRRGVIRRDVIEMELGRIAQVEVSSGLFNRLFGIGTIKVIALDQFELTLRPIAHPEQVKDLLMTAAAESRRAPAVAPQIAPVAVQGRDDVLGALGRLGKLKESGVLSEAEFQAKKRELLSRL